MMTVTARSTAKAPITDRARKNDFQRHFWPSDRGKALRGRPSNTKKADNMNGNIAIAGAALGGTIALGLIGFKAAEAVGRNPGASGKILVQALLSAALAEGALIITILMGK